MEILQPHEYLPKHILGGETGHGTYCREHLTPDDMVYLGSLSWEEVDCDTCDELAQELADDIKLELHREKYGSRN